MSDNSRSRVTVTLGRSGRVVKRAGGVPEDGFSNGMSMVGSKRSLRDRLGGNSDDRNPQFNKRQRGETFGTSSLNDMRLGKDDLRFKLVRKSMVRQSRNNGSHANFDLRDKLSSRTSRPSVDSNTPRPPEATISTRQPAIEPRNTGMTRHSVPDPRDSGLLMRLPSSRNASGLPPLDSSRTYSSSTLNGIRQRSPERLLHFSAHRELSPERSRVVMQRRQLIRANDDGRSSSSMRISPSRPVNFSPFLTKSSLSAGPTKSTPLPVRYPQAGGFIQKITSAGNECLTVESLLHSLGLEKYSINFKAEEIDMNVLRQMGDNDLKEMGIPMGPRKKILQAVMSRSRRHP